MSQINPPPNEKYCHCKHVFAIILFCIFFVSMSTIARAGAKRNGQISKQTIPVHQGWQYKYMPRFQNKRQVHAWIKSQDDLLDADVWQSFELVQKKEGFYELPKFSVQKQKELWLRVPLPIFDINKYWPALMLRGGIKDEFFVYSNVQNNVRLLYYQPPQIFFIWNHIIKLDHTLPGQYIYFRFMYEHGARPFFGDMVLGSEGHLVASIWKDSLDNAITSLLTFILGLISLFVFLARKTKRILPFLSFGFFALSLSVYLFSKSNIRLFFLADPFLWVQIELLSLYLLPLSVTLFFFHTFGKGYKQITKRLWQVYFASFVAAVSGNAILKIPLLAFLPYFQICILIGLIYLMSYSIVLSFKSHRSQTEARIFTIGFLVLGVLGIYNVLGAMRIIDTFFSSVYLGSFAFVISLVAILIYRVVLTYRTLQNFSHELKKKNKALVDAQKKLNQYNVHLEDMVHKRTMELSSKNELMLRDLRMAQRVQQNIIPNEQRFPKSDNLEFGSKYLSMDDVGGDLYDIIRVSQKKYAFLIADVSGHGVPAALITTMAKVAYHSHTIPSRPPGEINFKVHQDLFHFIGDLEYYLTAYLGIIDLETGVFEYSNAGHHPALVYRHQTREIIPLDTEGILIGAVELGIFNSKSFVLQDQDRLIMYTDGIIEARNLEGELYDYDRLTQYIKAFGHLQTKDFVEKMIADVDQFCNGRPADDDRAVLCIDYSRDKEKISASGTIAKIP